MIQIRMTRKGLEVARYFPFIVFGLMSEDGGVNSLQDSPSPLIIEKEVKHGNIKKRN